MTQNMLDRSVAARTGESVRTVRRLGFHVEPAPLAGPGADDLRLVVDCPTCRRPAPYPGPAAGGAPALAECPARGCGRHFAVDPARVYAARP